MNDTAILHRYANPKAFSELAAAIAPAAGLIALALFAIGLPWGLVFAPADYQQGDSARIMFVHVPAAWMSMFIYACMAGCAIATLVWRHLLAEAALRAAAPLGAGFTAVALITGSLWGKPMWGTYWVWDARLTSVLILFFLYLGLIALRQSLEEEGDAAKLTAIIAIAGTIILPVIKFSVDWWYTLHQPSTRFTSTLDPSFRMPLWVMAAGFGMLFVALHLKAMRNEVKRRRAKALTVASVHGSAAALEPCAAPDAARACAFDV